MITTLQKQRINAVRKQLRIEAGARLLVNVQDGMLVPIPQPAGNADRPAGLHADLWPDVDLGTPMEQERGP